VQRNKRLAKEKAMVREVEDTLREQVDIGWRRDSKLSGLEHGADNLEDRVSQFRTQAIKLFVVAILLIIWGSCRDS
jgi:hypothetical protein